MMWNGSIWKHLLARKLHQQVAAALAIVVMTIIVYSPHIPKNLNLEEGDLATRTIVSPRAFDFTPSTSPTTQTKPPPPKTKIFTIDDSINSSVIAAIQQFFNVIRELRTHTDTPETPQVANFLSESEAHQLQTWDSRTFNTFEYLTIRQTQSMLSTGIPAITSSNLEMLFDENERLIELSSEQKAVMYSIISHYIKPNVVYNADKTKSVEKEIIPILPSLSFREGQPIIYKGDIINATQIQILKELGLVNAEHSLSLFFGIFCVTTLLFVLLERYLYYFNPEIHEKTRYFALIYLVMFVVVCLARVLESVPALPYGIHVLFLIPIPIAAMMISLLVTPNIAFLCGSIISLLVALSSNREVDLFTFLFLSNCVAIFCIYKKHSRQELIHSGYIIGFFNVVIVFSIGLITKQTQLIWFGSNGLVALLNGSVSAMLTLAILPYFESLFHITTRQTLLELTNLNHPLLKRLMQTAPGTYQHSLMVGNLAEAAAEALQADPILARVGAYFHDIGKMKRPMFFTENQLSGENPHTNLTARMSKLIISSHVKDGYEMALKYRLPESIQNMILEHHGTTLVSFFFNQAVYAEALKNPEVNKDEFRYPGPKPKTKESGILMLSDSVEAASRAMEKPTLQKIENLVSKIIKEKIDDNQFDHCPISLQELDLIKEAFLKVFRGLYHSRIDYQDELEHLADLNKSKTHGKHH